MNVQQQQQKKKQLHSGNTFRNTKIVPEGCSAAASVPLPGPFTTTVFVSQYAVDRSSVTEGPTFMPSKDGNLSGEGIGDTPKGSKPSYAKNAYVTLTYP